ncbi:MAG: tetratricopeptide repeat protein [Candidatus Gastranaerophilales bacterium]|nr:tetratricopeptide repeat protein [Candidatus Gastranaerophilales bacterium]
MGFIRRELLENINTDIEKFFKLLAGNLSDFLHYFATLQYKNLKTFYREIDNYSFFVIKGINGSGKSAFREIMTKSLDKNVLVFRYNCNDIVELDDIFFNLYKYLITTPVEKEMKTKGKTIFKPSSIDEKIMNFLKKDATPFVLILENFEKLYDEDGAIAAKNILSFLQYLSSMQNIKTIVFANTFNEAKVPLQEDSVLQIKIAGIEEDKTGEFFSFYNIEIPQSMVLPIHEATGGYPFLLNFLANSQKTLDLPLAEIMKEYNSQTANIESFLVKKLYTHLSEDSKRIIFYLAMFRHPVTVNVLKTIEHFNRADEAVAQLKDFMLIEEERDFETRDFVKEIIVDFMTDREKMAVHSKIADFYAEQIPLRPEERLLILSRATMYSEKFYHYNAFSKLEKNSMLSGQIASIKYNDDEKVDSEKIKYIASSKYYKPIIDMKQDVVNSIEKEIVENKPEEKECECENQDTTTDDEEILLTREERELLKATSEKFKPLSEENKDNLLDDILRKATQKELKKIDEADNPPGKKDEDDNTRAVMLYQSGLKLYEQDEAAKSTGYFKSALSLINEEENPQITDSIRMSLAKALIETYKYPQALECLDILNKKFEELDDLMKLDVLIEFAVVNELEKNYDAALKYYDSALELAQDFDNKAYVARINFNKGLIYDDLNNTEFAKQYYLSSIKNFEDDELNPVLASAYSNLANIFDEESDYQKAVFYYKKSFFLDEKTNNIEGQVKNLSCLANIFFMKHEIKLAVKVFIKQVQTAKKSNDNYLIASSYLELGDAFFYSKDFKNAIKAYLLAKKNIDGTISTDSKNKIERRFKNIVDEIGEGAYNFLLKELKKR